MPQSNPLAGPTWVANEIAGQGVLPRHPATLDVRSDGSLSGESGCNGYAGAMTVAGETLSFGELIATKKACPGEQRPRVEATDDERPVSPEERRRVELGGWEKNEVQVLVFPAN